MLTLIVAATLASIAPCEYVPRGTLRCLSTLAEALQAYEDATGRKITIVGKCGADHIAFSLEPEKLLPTIQVTYPDKYRVDLKKNTLTCLRGK